ncbi:prolyl oligopeptidase family serine peptidase [Erythrobacter sp. LQ02-29]|uniref:alpha/beta hydrolase family esterase n=1 Tax=Erythrobacter sp. LQ02-29 TaxID=2920384 RepID=UPI001F4DE767|nr:PHB depolymerase family esterase [Erythrobacter sp. LQ02-29]MCP9222184.1 prolyl oligopeptidase family serine peptidase [Erythrobacter sp. LQ02-29]
MMIPRSNAMPISLRTIALAALALLTAVASPAVAATCPLVPGGERMVAPGEGMKAAGVHVPAGLEEKKPAPLVILLHGSTATGAQMLRDSGLAETADRHGFLLAYPDAGIPAGNGFVWNIPGVPTVEGTIPGEGDRDDVAYLTTLIDRLVADGCVDPARVYVTGLSGGGRMTSWLGCVAPDRFAAIAPVVGLRAGNPLAEDPTRPDPATCRPDTPIAVVAFAGDEDRTNPIAGGGGGYWQYSMHAAEQRWAQLNECKAAPTTRWVSSDVYEERYGDCRDDAEVIGRVVVGKGHSWVPDNEALWELLSRHRRD